MSDSEPTNIDASNDATWAQVEVFGHRTHFGLVSEQVRFGAKFCAVRVPTPDPSVFRELLYAPAAVFSLTPCDEATARRLGTIEPGTSGFVPYRAASLVPPQYERLGSFLDGEEE